MCFSYSLTEFIIFFSVLICSGGFGGTPKEHNTGEAEQKQASESAANGDTVASDGVDSKIQAARERYLARKAAKK